MDSFDKVSPANIEQRLVRSHAARRPANKNETFNFEHETPGLTSRAAKGEAVVYSGNNSS
jgi:hypothetical protein